MRAETPFYYSHGADAGHVAEQERRVAAGREPFQCAAGCPCGYGPRLPYVCGCGQMSDTPGPCDACKARDRAPQGAQWQLFNPVRAQLAGQTDLGL